MSAPLDGSVIRALPEIVRCELEKVTLSHVLPDTFIRGLRPQQVVDEALRGTIVQLDGLVALWRSQATIEVPADWWQHFKQRWFPAWALRLWPVQVRRYDAAAVLPSVPVPAHGDEIRFSVWRSEVVS